MHSLYHTYSDYGIFRYKGLLNSLGSVENGLILHILKNAIQNMVIVCKFTSEWQIVQILSWELEKI